jgi:hypothetical protein
MSLDGTTDDGKLYACTEWSVQILNESTSSFTATFEQVRRFLE